MIKALATQFPLRSTAAAFALALFSTTMSSPVLASSIKQSHPPGWQKGIDFNSLPLEDAIVRVRGNGERKIALIVDPSCPVSRMQEQELESVDNVTIYTFVENLLHQPLGREYTQLIKCQEGNDAQAAAWENWMLKGQRPPSAASCQPPSIKAALGNLKNPDGKYYSQRSPTVVFETGITSVGLVRTDGLEEVLEIKFD